MAAENNPTGVEASNWTLATGTKPGDRQVYPITRAEKPAGRRSQSHYSSLMKENHR